MGWVIWLFIHIAFLTGYRNRIGALFTWWFAFTRDVRRERTFTTQQIETLRDVYDVPPACAERRVGGPGQRGRRPRTGAAHALDSPDSGRSPAPADVKHD